MAYQWDKYEFRICGHFLSALINADESGLEDGEARELSDWCDAIRADIPAGFSPGHWSSDSEESDDWGRCAATGLFAMRAAVSFHFYRA